MDEHYPWASMGQSILRILKGNIQMDYQHHYSSAIYLWNLMIDFEQKSFFSLVTLTFDQGTQNKKGSLSIVDVPVRFENHNYVRKFSRYWAEIVFYLKVIMIFTFDLKIKTGHPLPISVRSQEVLKLWIHKPKCLLFFIKGHCNLDLWPSNLKINQLI